MHKRIASAVLLTCLTVTAVQAGPVLICTSKPDAVDAATPGSMPVSGPAWTRKIYSELTNKDVLTCSNGQKEKLTGLLMSGDYRLVSLDWRSVPDKRGGPAVFAWFGIVVLAAING